MNSLELLVLCPILNISLEQDMRFLFDALVMKLKKRKIYVIKFVNQ